MNYQPTAMRLNLISQHNNSRWFTGKLHRNDCKDCYSFLNVTIYVNENEGNPTDLFDVTISPDVLVLKGCGLGGTSLINANVALDCDPRIFKDKVSLGTK